MTELRHEADITDDELDAWLETRIDDAITVLDRCDHPWIEPDDVDEADDELDNALAIFDCITVCDDLPFDLLATIDEMIESPTIVATRRWT